MNGLADVLHGGEAEDRDLAGFRIDLDVDDVRRRKTRPRRADSRRRGPTTGPPVWSMRPGQFVKRHGLVARAKHAALHSDGAASVSQSLAARSFIWRMTSCAAS